ncbi:MAG: hypothetical protein IJZ20_07265 [Clostridia bacterium]|nr:hypothetical protein [Clostridia bacterium]
MSIRSDNAKILRQLSLYLNLMADAIDAEMVSSIAFGCEREQREYAYATLLATYCGFDIVDSKEDKAFFRERFTRMCHIQEKEEFESDPYYKNIVFPDVTNESWEFRNMSFKPYEAFLANESVLDKDGRLFPQIGFFESEFTYPAVLQDSREWMTVTPHEIRTTLPAVKKSFGNVLTYGLGLGYFPYMVHLKDEVKSVTVVEKDERVIELFTKYILPQFDNKEKIKVICADAFEFAVEETPRTFYDFIFADTWHEPSDGISMYEKFKDAEKYSPESKYMYWIEDTLKYYMALDKNSDEDTSPIFKDSTSFSIKFIEN